MSHGLAPMADELGWDVGNNKASIEAKLGVRCATTPDNAESLYRWATEVIDELQSKGLKNLAAKAKLAEAMGLTRNPQFLATANISLRGTTDRHRVLGRLCREGQVNAVWSFNWDCWLESAFRAVGLHKREMPGIDAPHNWCTSYHVWYEGTGATKSVDVVQLFKAHGCLTALESAHGDFIISHTEMACDLEFHSPNRIARMQADLQDYPVVSLGWGASEPYIRQLFTKLANSALLGESLTIVDVNVSQPNLLDVAQNYTDPSVSQSVLLNRASPGTADELFLWIQVIRGLACIRVAADEYPAITPALEAMVRSVPSYDSSQLRAHWIVHYLDSWLPVWLRTCYMVSAQGHLPAKPGSSLLLPTEERDAHIPWIPASYRRDDLLSAALLLQVLQASVDMKAWELETFPGALWNARTQVAILPVPAWTEVDSISALSLRPLLESRHWENKSRIKECVLLTLNSPALSPRDAAEVSARKVRWAEAVSSEFGHRHLADPAKYRVIDIEELSDVAKESP